MAIELRNDAVTIGRWTARLLGGALAALILFIFVGDALAEGFGPAALTLREGLMMVAFVVAWLGLVAGWKWELAGGLMTIWGMLAFYLLDYLFSGSLPRGPILVLIFVPGLLYLYCSWLSRPDLGRPAV